MELSYLVVWFLLRSIVYVLGSPFWVVGLASVIVGLPSERSRHLFLWSGYLQHGLITFL